MLADLLPCDCGRGYYDADKFGSCYDCFLARRSAYVTCIYCDQWHSPAFDTCFKCRPQGRDEAARDLKLVILARDSFGCRYCGISEGDLQTDPRLIRPKCPPVCLTQHNHRPPCKPVCGKQHQHRNPGDQGVCKPGCAQLHEHLAADDDGIRPARLHIDHIRPCRWGGSSDPWNLQTLCGVCNISKGDDWYSGSRHALVRRSVAAAYLTYLYDYLSADEKQRLEAETASEGWGWMEAWDLVAREYRTLAAQHGPLAA